MPSKSAVATKTPMSSQKILMIVFAVVTGLAVIAAIVLLVYHSKHPDNNGGGKTIKATYNDKAYTLVNIKTNLGSSVMFSTDPQVLDSASNKTFEISGPKNLITFKDNGNTMCIILQGNQSSSAAVQSDGTPMAGQNAACLSSDGKSIVGYLSGVSAQYEAFENTQIIMMGSTVFVPTQGITISVS